MQNRELNNEERVRLVRCIADCQRVMDECPHSDNGWRNCVTCSQMETQIEEYHESIMALDADDASETKPDRIIDPCIQSLEVKVRKVANGNTARLNRLFQLKTEFATKFIALKEEFEREDNQLSDLQRDTAIVGDSLSGVRNSGGADPGGREADPDSML